MKLNKKSYEIEQKIPFKNSRKNFQIFLSVQIDTILLKTVNINLLIQKHTSSIKS